MLTTRAKNKNPCPQGKRKSKVQIIEEGRTAALEAMGSGTKFLKIREKKGEMRGSAPAEKNTSTNAGRIWISALQKKLVCTETQNPPGIKTSGRPRVKKRKKPEKKWGGG